MLHHTIRRYLLSRASSVASHIQHLFRFVEIPETRVQGCLVEVQEVVQATLTGPLGNLGAFEYNTLASSYGALKDVVTTYGR